jgi:type II secretory pathway pseudopilin PulG
MKRGGDTKSAQGFTIVETLIVLAVTSSLFLIAATMINGKQNKTDFQIGSRNLQQQFQQIINETASGYYPNNGFTCLVPGAGSHVSFSSGAATLGQNTGCIFIGKTVAFDTNTPDSYIVYSLAGRRLGGTNEQVVSPKDAWTTPIKQTEDNVKYPNNLQFVWGQTQSIAGVPSSLSTSNGFGIAFMSSFANFVSAMGNSSGSQQVELRGYSQWQGTKTAFGNIYDEGPYVLGFPLEAWAKLCFRSGGTDQSALITINDGLSVSMTINSGITCGV